MLNALQELLKAQTNRFFESRLHNMQDELEHVDTQLAELNDRRDQILDNIAFCKSRISK